MRPVGLLSLTILFVFVLGTSGKSAAAPTTLTVDSTGDAVDANVGDGGCADATGACTLRAAIQESNASAGDKDTIAFAIPSAPLTISPATVLPEISDPVVIDGTTQTGWVDDPIVELRGPGSWGLKITSGDTTVRGLVVNRFSNELLLDGEGGNLIAGNFIGTDATGMQDGGGGISDGQQIDVLSGEGNVIGGTTTADRNVIAGKGTEHVSLRSNDNVVQGNYIGTNADGDAAVGPQAIAGVNVQGGATGNLIGGNTSGAGNLISGSGTGVLAGVDTIVQGNLIGTDASGTESIPNGTGIQIGGKGTLIGGLNPLARNVISGNSNGGIHDDAGGAVIQGNLIGPDISGTKTPGNSNAPGNGTNGIALCGEGNLIGGTDSRARNVISGNGGAGVSLCNFGAIGNRIEGNSIGVDVNGAALGNRLSGIACCLIGSVRNVIGGTAAGAGNVIAHNAHFGVQISNTTSDTDQHAAAIRGNSIYANGILGIDLGHPAPGNHATANDPLDADTGPNGQQNYPVLDWTSTGTPTTVTGTLHSKPNETYQVEFFHNDVCDTFQNDTPPNGGRFGEGETFLGAIEVSTDANGNATIPATTFAVSTDVTDVITATATDENGSTSEFSECRADLETTKSDDPDPVRTGQTLTYTIDVANQGPAPALEVDVVDQLPTILEFALDAITPSQGSCALTDPFTDRYICSLGLIPRFGTASITITGTVLASAPTSITNTAIVSSELNDPDPDNNRTTAETQVVEDQPTGTIVVRKVTLPSSSPQTFSFSSSYDADGFSLGNGQSDTRSGLTPGAYSVSETPVAGWDTTGSCDDGSAPNAIQLAADETVTCTFTNTKRGSVTLLKTTNGVVDPSKDIKFVLTGAGLPSGGITRSTFSDPDGVLEFGNMNLVPEQLYTMCESPVPAGFTSFWKLDDVIVTPYNPDASKVPPEDLGTRCYQFQVSPGQERRFVVDNSRPGGDPRTIGYWKNWNRCTGGNQAATAAKNGGAAAGFFLVEDLLPQLAGDLAVTTCQTAVKLLAKQDQAGKNKASDAAYGLGAQLLAARFNLAAGAEVCAAIQQAVLDGQTLLDGINFTGSGDYLGSKSKDPKRAQALSLASTIDRYNNGNLC